MNGVGVACVLWAWLGAIGWAWLYLCGRGSVLLRGRGQGGVGGAKGVWAWPGLGVRAMHVCVLRAQWAGLGAGLSKGGCGLNTVGVVIARGQG